jgi:hypothetical protein
LEKATEEEEEEKEEKEEEEKEEEECLRWPQLQINNSVRWRMPHTLR